MNLFQFMTNLFSVKLTTEESENSWHLSDFILLKIVLSESQNLRNHSMTSNLLKSRI